jgi:hypothetical protein
LQYLQSAQAFFDDSVHYKHIQSLCSLTHPMADGKVFSSLKGLQAHVQKLHNRLFCNVCLEGRKVFISEQLTYDKQGLEHHMRLGDEEGPLAESGFKGHPECRFCHRRFYGDTELYTHMHANHEECFLCRRAAPHRHIYYRDYPDLDNHFRQEHFPCENPTCLEQKFVVFLTEQELKIHTLKVHGESLPKRERKAALTIPISFQYRSRQGLEPNNGLSTMSTNTRTVPSATANSAPSRASQIGAVSDIDGTVGAFSDLLLQDGEFPAIAEASTAHGNAHGSSRWVSTVAGEGSSRGLSGADFPALPGNSKSAKRRAAKKKTASQIVRGESFLSGHGPSNGLNKPGDGLQSSEQFPVLGGASRTGMPRAPSFQEVAGPSTDNASQSRSNDGVNMRISDALRSANQELIEKIKLRLGDDDSLSEFRKQSSLWLQGKISSSAYHAAIASLGLVSIVSELAATCPDNSKRMDLLDYHASAFQDAPGPQAGSWMPPEAARVAAQRAAIECSWECNNCHLINAPKAQTCEGCGHIRPIDSESKRVATKPVQSKGKKDKGKQSLSEFMQSSRAHPQNPWKNTNLRGQWASGAATGKSLVNEERALNEAWRKR